MCQSSVGRCYFLITLVYFRHNNDGANKTISREIHKNNTSKWSINGRNANQKVVSIETLRLC